jgi:hypothetical protein
MDLHSAPNKPKVFWLHDEALRKPDAYQTGDRLVFLWDPNYFAQQAWSLKRRVFIYECLVALQAEIYVASPTSFWREFFAQAPALSPKLFVAEALDPQLQAWLAQLSAEIEVKMYRNPSLFLKADLQPSRLKRFSHFWPVQAKSLGLSANKTSSKTRKHQ